MTWDRHRTTSLFCRTARPKRHAHSHDNPVHADILSACAQCNALSLTDPSRMALPLYPRQARRVLSDPVHRWQARPKIGCCVDQVGLGKISELAMSSGKPGETPQQHGSHAVTYMEPSLGHRGLVRTSTIGVLKELSCMLSRLFWTCVGDAAPLITNVLAPALACRLPGLAMPLHCPSLWQPISMCTPYGRADQ